MDRPRSPPVPRMRFAKFLDGAVGRVLTGNSPRQLFPAGGTNRFRKMDPYGGIEMAAGSHFLAVLRGTSIVARTKIMLKGRHL
jgi:hypothetical protein